MQFWLMVVVWLGLSGLCGAQETAPLPEPVTHASGGLKAVDWTIIGLYGCSAIFLGWWYGRSQKSTQEYFVGSGQMNPLLIGVSLFATLLSTITYLSMPGETAGKGPVVLITALAYPAVFLTVGYWLLPVYMRHRVTSAYELLEKKLGLSIRLLGASMFLALRLVWMSLLVFLTAKAIVLMIDPTDEMGRQGKDLVPIVAAITGTVAVIYTSIGGLRAVVITDLMQTILLYGGALLVLLVVTYDFGGFGWFPTTWQPNWDEQPVFSLDPKVRITMVGSLVSMFLWSVCTAGGDQTSVQRFMATTDARAARRALGVQMTVSFVVNLTLGLVGFALLAYFQSGADRLPGGMSVERNADQLFPHFVAWHLPIGISGLVVAGMFAAAMSSLDSGVNSITAVITTDFLDRFGLRPQTERNHVRVTRLLAFSIGFTAVIGSTFMKYVPGNIMAMTQKTSNLLTTPIFCLFVFALFIPFARPIGVWAGAICGTATAAFIAFSGPLVLLLAKWGIDPAFLNTTLEETYNAETGAITDPITFQWIPPLAIFVNLTVGCLVSLAVGGRSSTNNGRDSGQGSDSPSQNS